MPGRGADLLVIPGSFWQRPDVITVLRERDIARLLDLVTEATGATQTQIAVAWGTTQPKIRAILKGPRKVEYLTVFEDMANGLDMPDPARIALGLAPRAALPPRPATPQIATGPDVIAEAANEATADRISLAVECDTESLDWLRSEAIDIARAANRPALEAFRAARRVRRAALDLVERTRRPALLSELYAISGQATALMASNAFDLNRWDESDALAKSAVLYASLAGHDSLQAWTFGLSALLANWRHDPDIALSHFKRGMRVAPRGEPRVRLRYIATRSHALLGDTAAAADVLTAAREDQDYAERHPDALGTEIGGEFAFGRPRAEACAAAAWLDLGNGPEALTAAQSALATLTSLPPARRSLSQVSGARIDMTTAYLLSKDLDGGAQTLAPVLEQRALMRNVSLTGRLARTRTTLLAPEWAANPQARQLGDDIGEWLSAGSQPAGPARLRRP